MLFEKIIHKGNKPWNVKNRKISINATAHMNPAAEKESVAIVLHII